MAKQPYYGLAGIFSTDNAAADQSQIDCERGPAEEYEEDDYEETERCSYLDFDTIYSDEFGVEAVIVPDTALPGEILSFADAVGATIEGENGETLYVLCFPGKSIAAYTEEKLYGKGAK